MTRLILSELLNSARVWAGVLALSVVTGAVGFVAAAFVVSGGHATGDGRQLTASAGQMLIAFTSISALVGLAGASNLTVALQRRSLALWQLAGVRPAIVGFAVLAQLAIVGAVGAGIGCLIVMPALEPFFSWIQRSWTGIDGIDLRVGPGAAISTVAIVCGVVALGGLRGALAASRVAPIDALREPESTHRGMGWGRWMLAAAAAAATTALAWRLDDAPFLDIVNRGMFVIPAVAACIAALGPLVFPLVLRTWTSLIPARLSSSWFLARHDARYRLSRSTAVIGPLLVAVALTSGLFTATRTFGAAADGGDWSIDAEAVVLILGGPLLVAAVSAAVTVFMASAARARDAALVQVAGGRRRTVLLAAVWEAMIHGITATVIGAGVTVAGSVYLAQSLGVGAPQVAWSAVAVVAIGGSVLILAATLIPAISALRAPLPQVLQAS